MPRWETVGEVSRFGNGFRWQVNDRYFMPYGEDAHIASPPFGYADSLWYFTKQPEARDWFGLGLRGTTSQGATLLVRLVVRTRDGEDLRSCEGRTGPYGCFEEQRFFRHSQFAKRRTEIAPGGYVNILLDVQSVKGSWTPSTAETSRMKNGGKNEQKIHRCIQTDDPHFSKGIIKLQKDLKNLLFTEEESDITIKVQEREFLAHKIILRARCPVFYAMFKHMMVEQISRVVVIDDCDPDCFQHFLNYIYSGSTEGLTGENVFPLYVVADKYCLDDLKSDCIEFIMKSLTTETFCDARTLSIRYSEAELLEMTSDFFSKNMTDILSTAQWEEFLHENTVEGNEMLTKVLIRQKNM